IKVGMTQAEVVAILGTPGDQSTMDVEPDADPSARANFLGNVNSSQTPDHMWLSWTTDTAEVTLVFAGKGVVEFGICVPSRPVPASIWRRLQKRAERLWREWFP